MADTQVGIIACSGEECLGGTLSRMATRKVMEELQEGKVVSLCLPLYIAGGEEERAFAKNYPVIAIDGCNKSCAERATIKYSSQVKDRVVISDMLGEDVALSKIVSARKLTNQHYEMADKIANEISMKVDKIISE